VLGHELLDERVERDDPVLGGAAIEQLGAPRVPGGEVAQGAAALVLVLDALSAVEAGRGCRRGVLATPRLQLLGLIDDRFLRSEIEAALTTTLAFGLGRNESLCHGALGNLEPVLQASMLLRDLHLGEQLRPRCASILAAAEHHSWRCGNAGSVDSPELMTGLAGIGYGLLRLADPSRVPSVFTLVPPAARRGPMGRGRS
jgi:hypothetical protein